MPYEGWPLETDPATLAIDAHTWLQSRWPDYRPSPANFDSGTIDAHARMDAEVRDIAANVPDAIFMRFGELAGITVPQAAYATVTATITAQDTRGYTMPAGTVLGIRATGDTLYTFASDDDVTILPNASTSPAFTLTATETGSGPNGLGGVSVAMTVVDRTLPWLASAQTATTVTGGQDAQGVEDFLSDLVTALRLLRASPMNADDLADFAKSDAAVARAYAIDRYQAGTDERQTIGPHDSTGGTFTLTYSGQTTAAIAWNATAAVVQAALIALSNIGPSDVQVTGGPLPATALTVRFTGALGEANVAQMTSTGTALTGGSDTVPIATTVGGVAPNANADKAATVWVIDADGLDPGEAAKARILAAIEDVRELGFAPAVRAPGYDSVSVEFEADAYPGWDPADVQARAIETVQQFLSPARRGIPLPAFGDPGAGAPWYQDPIIRLTDIVAALENVDGLWRLTGPGANGLPKIEGSAADYTLVGFGYQPVVLSTAGTITGTVSAP
jgi:hypothetical protein